MQAKAKMNKRATLGYEDCQKMERMGSQLWSTSSVGSSQKTRVCLCGLPAVSKTSWSNKNFGRRYSRCSMKKGCSFFNCLEPPKTDDLDSHVLVKVEKVYVSEAERKWKDKEVEIELLKEREAKLQKEKEMEIEKNEKEILMKCLKESQEREERYLKMLLATWVLVGCIVVSMVLRGM